LVINNPNYFDNKTPAIRKEVLKSITTGLLSRSKGELQSAAFDSCVSFMQLRSSDEQQVIKLWNQ